MVLFSVLISIHLSPNQTYSLQDTGEAALQAVPRPSHWWWLCCNDAKPLLEEAVRAVGGALATHAEAVVPAVMKTACHAVLDTPTRKSMLPKLRQGACGHLQRCTGLSPAVMLRIQHGISDSDAVDDCQVDVDADADGD